MPAARLTMRTIREILRLRLDLGRTHREIADACLKSPSTIGDCLTRFRMSELPWPLPDDLSDAQLEEKLYPKVLDLEDRRPVPDWEEVLDVVLRQEHKLGEKVFVD